jgi:prephenate dehydrogenase
MRVIDLGDAQVSIVGLGLMGGSLAGALRGRCKSVVGVARRPETLEFALAHGLIDRGTSDSADALCQADVVILATPVRVIIRQLRQLAPLVPPGCLLLDLGSTKSDIVAEMARLPDHIQPLGGHPMCGKEVSGIEAADPGLFEERTFILTPLPRTSEAALELGKALAEAVGARPLVLDADRQDYLIATLSHLPYLLACALVATADATTSADRAAWEIVAGGYRDTSRVAGSDVTMMTDILLTNQEEILKALGSFETQLRKLSRLVAAGDEREMKDELGRIRQERVRMFP